jgi:hypothetical protein
LLEEPDFGIALPAVGHSGHAEAFTRIAKAIGDLYRSMGTEYQMGRKLPALLEAEGLQQICAETFIPLARGGSGIANVMKRSVDHLRDPLIGTNAASALDVDRYLRLCDDPSFWAIYYATVSVCARKPGSERV